jgi:hypothetical protein
MALNVAYLLNPLRPRASGEKGVEGMKKEIPSSGPETGLDRFAALVVGELHHVIVKARFIEPPPNPGLRREGSRGDEKGNS